MDGIIFFITRALLTLIPLIAIAFSLGLWLGWLKWHGWKKQYQSVEHDYHKLYDHHDAASVVIDNLETTRGALATDREKLQTAMAQFKEANETYATELDRLQTTLTSTQRNSRDLEDLWKKKLDAAQVRIHTLEAALAKQTDPGHVPQPLLPQPILPVPAEKLKPTPLTEHTTSDHHIIPFPPSQSAPAPRSKTKRVPTAKTTTRQPTKANGKQAAM